MPELVIWLVQNLDAVTFVILAAYGHYKGVWKWAKDVPDCKKAEQCCEERGKAMDDIHAKNSEKLDRLEQQREIEWQISSRTQGRT